MPSNQLSDQLSSCNKNTTVYIIYLIEIIFTKINIFLCNFCTKSLICGQLSGHIHLADQAPVLRASLPACSCALNVSGQPFQGEFHPDRVSQSVISQMTETVGCTPQFLPHALVSSSVPNLISHPESQGVRWKSSESSLFRTSLTLCLRQLGCDCSGREALTRMLPTYPGEAGMGTRAGQPLLGPRANLPGSHLRSAHPLPRPPSSLRGGDPLGDWPRQLCRPEPRAGLEDTPLAVAVRAAADDWACRVECCCFAAVNLLRFISLSLRKP